MASPIAPTCPRCSAPAGAPIAEAGGRFTGPPSSNVVCTACGAGWVATQETVEQAETAQRWAREEEKRG